MRVTRFVGVLVVLPMMRDPIDGATFKRQCSQQSERVFHGFRAFERTVREQAMIAHADSQSSEEGVQEDADADCRPGCMPENADDSQMHGNQEAHFDRLELVANGNGWSGRERHTDLSHEITSNARPGIGPSRRCSME